MFKTTDDIRIKSTRPLISPAILAEEFPITEDIATLVAKTRHEISQIINNRDRRLLVVVGPCSIHDPKAALEYAKKLAKQTTTLHNKLLIIMRVYFEKPRTTVGWKGLINDPHLNGSFDINNGLRIARRLLIEINSLGLPVGTEFLDTIIPQYISDLISWGAIGARTTESQIHRELASGLSMPLGFKNGTTGDVQIAVDAVRAARHSHHFLGVTKHGIPAILGTTGNDACHIILRGSNTGPNYDADSINAAVKLLKNAELPPYLMVDCSHGNSEKDHKKQAIVVKSLCEQITKGNKAIRGVMLESNLVAGKQALHDGKNLVYGQSVTDACIDLKETKQLLQNLAKAK
jgi:3-deoxy-7-phosphoheptulonate synthase